jgi:hypothetical protein
MASFLGTKEDFNTYIGPRIRNLVNQIAKKDRDARNGICQHCGEKAKLDSAHKHGKGRKTLIEMALKDFDKGPYIEVDLTKFEELFIKYHQPINETFLFLCRKCHNEYDRNYDPEIDHNGKEKNAVFISVKKDNIDQNLNSTEEEKEIQKIKRKISGWVINKEQINSKILYAFINLYKKFKGNVNIYNLSVEAKESGVSTFDGNFNQMKNFGEKNHGKIFDQRGDNVYLWKPVEKIVWDNYNKYNGAKNGI